MSVELQALRTAKAAVDEGLMQPTDYNAVKQAFVRALAIKGGVDSGFLGQSDFADARREFFQSLGMSNLGGGSGPVASAQPVPTFPVQAPTPVQQAQIPLAPSVPQTNGTDNSATTPPNRSTQGAAPAPRPPVPLLSIPETQASTAETTPTGIGHLTPQATVCTPSTISNRGGGTAAVASKKSMSGISVHPDSVNIVWELRVKKMYQWVLFQISGTGKEVVIAKAAQPESTWNDFISSVPDSQCRYGVFDYKYVNSEGTEFGKLVFLSWAPDLAPTKAKMQHASTKDLFRGLLDGVSVELHATDLADLSEDAVRAQVASTVKIK